MCMDLPPQRFKHREQLSHQATLVFQIECSSIIDYSEKIIKANGLDNGQCCYTCASCVCVCVCTTRTYFLQHWFPFAVSRDLAHSLLKPFSFVLQCFRLWSVLALLLCFFNVDPLCSAHCV